MSLLPALGTMAWLWLRKPWQTLSRTRQQADSPSKPASSRTRRASRPGMNLSSAIVRGNRVRITGMRNPRILVVLASTCVLLSCTSVSATLGQVSSVSPAWTHKEIAEGIKPWIEIVAYCFAGLFFCYKVFFGMYYPSLVVNVTCERTKSSSPLHDGLVVTTTIKNDGTRAVCLHTAEASFQPIRARDGGGKPTSKPFPNLNRVEVRKDGKLEESYARRLNIPPGDGTVFSLLLEVPSEEAHLVVVTLLGGWMFQRRHGSQWRATQVSLPISARETDFAC